MAHLVQSDIAWEDAPANHERVRTLLRHAPVEPGDFVLLPEMFATGFSFNVERTNDDDGRTLAFLEELVQTLHVTIQAGRTLAARGPSAAHNVMTALAPGPESNAVLLAEYTKVHPFQKEAERFEGGREVVTYAWTGDDRALTVCPAVCYDLRFPELFRRGLARGAELFALGACWPSVRQHHWRALLVARAVENQAFVLGCNRTGRDPAPPVAGDLRYAGGTIALSPTGDVLGELGEAEGVLSVPIDRTLLDDWRAKFSAWKDARLR